MTSTENYATKDSFDYFGQCKTAFSLAHSKFYTEILNIESDPKHDKTACASALSELEVQFQRYVSATKNLLNGR